MLAALALAGCGGSTLSHGDFVKRANAVCAAYRADTSAAGRPRTYDQIVAYVQKVLPLYRAALIRLEALQPPKTDAAAVHAWLAADRRVAAALRTLGEAAERRDYPSVQAAAASIATAGDRSRLTAAGLGAQVCVAPAG